MAATKFDVLGIGNAIFKYRCYVPVEGSCVSMWSLVFYGRKWFVALTGPKLSPLLA